MRKDKEIVKGMFDSIAGSYDFLNHALSLGIDKRWRKRVAKMVATQTPKKILDVATGTGDLALAILKRNPQAQIVGVDMSPKMLEIAEQKRAKLGITQIEFEEQDALSMTFQDGEFDVVTISFGVRNFENLDKGLGELRRVVKKGGRVVIMEVSTPNKILGAPYMIYFKYVLPFVGRLFSKNNSAYSYLANSVIQFPSGEDFVSIMRRNGYSDIKYRRLTGGVATIYTGVNL